MLSKIFIYFFLILFSTSAICQQSPNIYLYRLKKFTGRNIPIQIRIGDSTTIKLKNNSIKSILWTKPTFDFRITDFIVYHSSKISMKIDSGRKYYIRCELKNKIFFQRIFFYTVSEEEGEKDFKEIELNSIKIKKDMNCDVVKTKSIASFPLPQSDKSYIYFFRPHFLFGCAVPIKIKISDSLAISVANNTSFSYQVEPGDLNLTTINRGIHTNKLLSLKIERGRNYYIWAGFTRNGMVGLQECDEDTAKKVMIKKKKR